MYKNVQVNHYNNANSTDATTENTTTAFSSSTTSKADRGSTKFSNSISILPSTSSRVDKFASKIPNSTIEKPSSDGGITLPVSYNSSKENMSFAQSSKLKSEVDQLDDLVKDLLTEVHRPIGSTNNLRSSNSNIPVSSNNNPKYTTSSSSYSYHRRSNNENNEQSTSKLPSSIRASSYTQASTLNNQKRNDFDANTVSGLIEGASISSNGVQREEQRVKSTREERIRIKRGAGSSATDIPITTSSSVTTTTTTTNKPTPQTGSSRDQLTIDEQLIDSLLESVQNTLRKRSQQQRMNQTNWTADVPIQQHGGNSRRTYSSSAAYTDSIHRMDPIRGRFPIKLQRTESPTSTLSSRRPYSRQDNRDGYGTTVTSASTTAIPNHFRATSEPPPDGPIELRRIDLVRSPSRSYFDGHPQDQYYYSRSTLPPGAGGIRVRGHDYSGYETDTGVVTSRAYGPRYYGAAPQPPPQLQTPYYGPAAPPSSHPQYYPQQPMHFVRERHQDGYSGSSNTVNHGHRGALRPDGYDTDTGLISSGRLRMTRTLPPRMAAIPETLVLNNRMVSSSNLNTLPTNLRSSSFLNENTTNTMRSRTDHLGGYETDSGMHIRQPYHGRRVAPVDVQCVDSGWVGKQTTSRPISQQQQQQQRIFESNSRHYRQPQYQSQDHIRSASIPVFSHDGSTTVSSRLPEQHTSNTIKTQTQQHQQHQQQHQQHQQHQQQHQRNGVVNQEQRFENTSTGKTPATPTFPVTNHSYHQNIQARVGNSSRAQEETSRRSSVSSMAESDVLRHGAYQAHNVSQFWYKEKMSREDAINLLKTKPAGTFLIRDSQGFPGSYGLAVKVETLPPGIQSKPGADPNAELVRHYLIERTPNGHVRLKGCPNEPDFANLSALVYQHSITPLALPTRLVLPTIDITEDHRTVSSHQEMNKKISVKDLLERGAACNVLYLNNIDVESLSGQLAVSKALKATFENPERLQATIVHFKVSNTGITLTDTKKKLFSRRHFPKEYVTYCGVDYEAERFWTFQYADLDMLPRARCFGFVSKKINGSNTKSGQNENECHIFAEIDRTQPSTAIVNFVSKVMIGSVPV